MDFDPDHVPLVFLDVETTGASAAHGERVTELAIARIENGEITRTFCQLFEVDRRIPPWIVALTGISDDMLQGQPSFGDKLDEIRSLCDGAAIVGHNVLFDLSFIASELRRAQSSLMDLIGARPVLDTVRLARRLVQPRGNSLQKLAIKFNCVPTTAHRAMADVETTFEVYKRILEPHGGHHQHVARVVKLQGGPIRFNRKKMGETTLPIMLSEAVKSGRDLRIEYLDSQSRSTMRLIRPLQLIRNHAGSTLIAYCHLRNDRRTFRLDRIVNIDWKSMTDETLFDIPKLMAQQDLIANQIESV